MALDLVYNLIEFLDTKKAKAIEAYHLEEKTKLAKYLVLATLPDEHTARALAESIEKKFSSLSPAKEGEFPGDWIILDFKDVVLELFVSETREKYNLEKLWGDSSNRVEYSPKQLKKRGA